MTYACLTVIAITIANAIDQLNSFFDSRYKELSSLTKEAFVVAEDAMVAGYTGYLRCFSASSLCLKNCCWYHSSVDYQHYYCFL